MRDLLVPGMAVAASAMNHDDPAAPRKIGDYVGQRGLTRIVHVDRVSVDIDVLGRHRRSPLICAFARRFEGLVFGSRRSCQTRLGVRGNGEDYYKSRSRPVIPENPAGSRCTIFRIRLEYMLLIRPFCGPSICGFAGPDVEGWFGDTLSL